MIGPEPRRYAEAERWAAVAAEHMLSWSNGDACRVLAFDVLLEYVEGSYLGPLEQVAWALLWSETATELEPAELTICRQAWRKADPEGSISTPVRQRH
jgi:hypothetical protein